MQGRLVGSLVLHCSTATGGGAGLGADLRRVGALRLGQHHRRLQLTFKDTYRRLAAAADKDFLERYRSDLC